MIEAVIQISLSVITTFGLIAVALIQNRNGKDSKRRNDEVMAEQKMARYDIEELLRRNKSISKYRTIIETTERDLEDCSRDLILATAEATKAGTDGNGELDTAIGNFKMQRTKTRKAIRRAHADMESEFKLENLSDILI
jgi:hypothetical protein